MPHPSASHRNRPRPLATAMVLAAGRGERMRPLTDQCPKPLLQVRGQPLMQWALQGLQRGGVARAVVNTAWLGEQIEAHFGSALHSPTQASLALDYSHEGVDFGHALETAGGIVRALPQLAEVFWVAAGDVYAPDFVFSAEAYARFEASPQQAHLWLVPNPEHNPAGDFALSPGGLALNAFAVDAVRYTFSTIALYKRTFFDACGIPAGNPAGVKAPLAALLRAAINRGEVSASLYSGTWVDVGTPERLAQLS